MSELKCVKQSDVMWGHWFTEYYLKSEADKVIAEKDAVIVELQAKNKRLEEIKDKYSSCAGKAINNIAKCELKIRSQKYKRCLDKADLCEARYDEEDAKVNGCGASWEYISKEMKYWERWHKRWLKIAEKFKEGV